MKSLPQERVLVIGNKTYSSWSLRPWLLMKHLGIPFSEVLVKLDLPETRANILRYSPAARVPVLIEDGFAVWESLAIMEYLHERFPEKMMYPADPKARARARTLAHEMHSGFSRLREHLSFHAKKRFPAHDVSVAADDIHRVVALWSDALNASGGPFLFGGFSIADAMFAPVVSRFHTYGVKMEGDCAAYCTQIFTLPAMREWYDEAHREDFIAADHE
jgi:glutathione S-transferase